MSTNQGEPPSSAYLSIFSTSILEYLVLQGNLNQVDSSALADLNFNKQAEKL